MLGFITDDNNDLILDDLGNLRMESGLEAYRQHIVNQLRLQQYEYPYALNDGVNYLGYIMGRAPNIKAWEAQVLELINNMPFVQKIVDWGYNIADNNFLFSLTVDTDLGQITVKG